MKNRYGVTPWGSWFIDILDSYRMGERLDRGRRYANAGRVLSLELTDGRAVAKVEGNYSPFYKVSIIFPPLKDSEKVFKMIENDKPLLARIASGELPETFLQKLKKENINLIPVNWREMKRSCTCPDYGDPCKHMAALYYIIAREIDADPHVLFRLRGMDLASRFGKAAVHRITAPFAISYDSKPSSRKKTSAKGSPTSLSPIAQSSRIQLEEIPHCGELISSLLSPQPPFCDRDFAIVMAEFYHRCALYQPWESHTDESITDNEHDFSRSHWTIQCQNPKPGASPVLYSQDINGIKKRYSIYEAFEYFVQFSSDDGTESYTFLFYLFKFINLVCSAGAFIPYILIEGEELLIIWRPYETLPLVAEMQKAIAELECGMLKAPPSFRINLSKKNEKPSAQKAAPQAISGRSVVDLLTSAFLNEWVRRKFILFRSYFVREGNDEYRKLLNLFFMGMETDVSSPAQRSLPVAIDRWLSVLHIDFSAYSYAINIKDETKRNDERAAFDFSLSMDVISENETGVVKTPLSKCSDLEILRAPTALSNYMPEIRQLTGQKSVSLSEARLVSFLDSASILLGRLGIKVNLPKSLAKELKPRLVIKGSTTSGSLVKYLDINALQDFKWQIAIGDEVLSLDEFKKLVKEKRALVRFRDGFVKMEPEEFSRLLKKGKEASPDINDFLKAHFSGDSVLAFDEREVINNLFREHNFDVPAKLTAKLRPYQKRGYNWICSLLLSGFGCILADDMGLGKTVQSIAAVLRLKGEGLLKDGCFVVAPAALISNWEKELSRFAPSLRISRYHGTARKLNRKSDVFLTTYQTAVRDSEKLKKEAFSLLLVDEAHLMKNAETRISRTIKQLRSKYRLALSGTPVENRLEDLRSLFDFILPGYLGDAAKFKEQYRVPIEVMRNREKADSLRKITSPFLLRRVKTDKSIIKDLPDKIVTNEYAVLEKDQAALYESVVSESIKKSEKLERRERSALIFNLLTSLKQICYHPRVYDKESPAISQLSGKAQLLL
ncbi:MAG: DEAD/DEAH box helicase family protein, partial [Treponema sp.]|nr:DEAD/DEAH box helicase family protein [Treponema sp.]